MGEGVSANISASSGTTAISLFIRGEISEPCLESLRVIVKAWAQQCGLEVDDFGVTLKTVRRRAAKK